jgi:hypothetical protein
MSMRILESLHLSNDYLEVMKRASDMLENWSFSQSGDGETNDDARLLAVCLELSELLHSNISRTQFTNIISDLSSATGLQHEEFLNVLQTLPEQLKEYCRNLEMNVPSLPDFIKDISFKEARVHDTSINSLSELREAVNSGETLISVIGCALDCLVNGLSFTRAIFLTPNANNSMIEGRLCVGDMGSESVQSLKLPSTLSAAGNVASSAWQHKKMEITGEPVFPDSWPCLAFPVGFGIISVGVVYADMRDTGTQLHDSDIATLSMIAEMLDKSVRNHKEGL